MGRPVYLDGDLGERVSAVMASCAGGEPSRMFEAYCRAIDAAHRDRLRRTYDRDEKLAPIRLLIARREARALLDQLASEEVLRRQLRADRRAWCEIQIQVEAGGARDALAAIASAHDELAHFYPAPWWSPFPESITGVLRAWWRRRRGRC